MKIAGAVALVTGANRGIGAGIVRELTKRGAAKIYAGMRDPLQTPEFEPAPHIIPLLLDVANPAQCQAAAEQAADVTLLVNNAGASHFGVLLTDPRAPDALRVEMEVNVFGLFHMSRAFVDILGRNGGGAIVNVLSASALMNVPLIGTYSATKAAALSLTQGFRAMTAAQKTLVVAAIVGSVETRMVKDVPANVPKVSPDFVAAAILTGVERNEEDIDTDPMAVDIRARLARDPKKLERFYARGVQPARQA